MPRGTDIAVYADEDDGDFVMSSCTECRRRMRANRLHHVIVEVQSGRRSGTSRSTYWGKRLSTRSGSSSSTYYKNVAKRMCDPCFEAYERSRAAVARMKLIGYGVVAAFFLYIWAKPSTHIDTPEATSQARIDVPVQAQLNNKSSAVHYTSFPPASSSPTAVPEASSRPPEAQGFHALTSSAQPAEPPASPAPPPEDYYRVNYLANVRSSPNNGPVMGQAQEGEELSVVEVKGAWARVRRGNDIIGWVHRKLLTPSR